MFQPIIMFMASELDLDKPTIIKPIIKYYKIISQEFNGISVLIFLPK